MSLPRRMSAGLACNTVNVRGVNVNQIQYGDKLQGLPPVTGRRTPYKSIRAKEGGNLPDRHRIFCINQLGSIGMGNKNSQFASNADGVGPCPNRKNHGGYHGLHRHALSSIGAEDGGAHVMGMYGTGSFAAVDRSNLTSNFHDFASDDSIGGHNPDLGDHFPFLANNFAVEGSACNGVDAISEDTSCSPANCSTTVQAPYCPDGWEPWGNGSACRKSGFTDCGSNLENCCDLFSNPVLGCCSDSDFNTSVKCGSEAPTGPTPPDATTICRTIPEPYPNAGQQACCPKGWEPWGNGSACRKSGSADCGSNNENCCDLFSNSVLGCCSDSEFDANAKCCTGADDATGCKNPPSDPYNCRTIPEAWQDGTPMVNAGQQACCPKGWEPYENGSACRKSGSAYACRYDGENCCDLFSNSVLGCCSDSNFNPSVKCATSMHVVKPPTRDKNVNKKSTIIGYRWDCSNPVTPIPSECDTQTNLIMLASFCPSPFSISNCDNAFGMCAHSNNATGEYPTPFGLDIIHRYAKQVSDEVSDGHRNLDPYVLISIGGPSFGLSDWLTLAVGPNAQIKNKNSTSGTGVAAQRICGVPWHATLPAGWHGGGKEYSGDYSPGLRECSTKICPGIFTTDQDVSFKGLLGVAMNNLCQKKAMPDAKCDNHRATCNELLQEYVRIVQIRYPDITDIDIVGRLPLAPHWTAASDGGPQGQDIYSAPFLSLTTQGGNDWTPNKLPEPGAGNGTYSTGLLCDLNFQLLVARDIQHPIRAQDILLNGYPCSPSYEGKETPPEWWPAAWRQDAFFCNGTQNGGWVADAGVKKCDPQQHGAGTSPTRTPFHKWTFNPCAVVCGSHPQDENNKPETAPGACNQTGSMDIVAQRAAVLGDWRTAWDGAVKWTWNPPLAMKRQNGGPVLFLLEYAMFGGVDGANGISPNTLSNTAWDKPGFCRLACSVWRGGASISCVKYLFEETKQLDNSTYTSKIPGSEGKLHTLADITSAADDPAREAALMGSRSFRAECLFRVLAYSGAHGFDLDYEGMDSDGLTGIQITLLMVELKEMARQIPVPEKTQQCIITMTTSAGSSYGVQGWNNTDFKDKLVDQTIAELWEDHNSGFYSLIKTPGKPDELQYDLNRFMDDASIDVTQLGPPPRPPEPRYPKGPMSFIYQSFLYADCPYDYVMPKFYSDVQYPWSITNVGWKTWDSKIALEWSWNALLSYWCDTDDRITPPDSRRLIIPSKSPCLLVPSFVGYKSTCTWGVADLARYCTPNQGINFDSLARDVGVGAHLLGCDPLSTNCPSAKVLVPEESKSSGKIKAASWDPRVTIPQRPNGVVYSHKGDISSCSEGHIRSLCNASYEYAYKSTNGDVTRAVVLPNRAGTGPWGLPSSKDDGKTWDPEGVKRVIATACSPFYDPYEAWATDGNRLKTMLGTFQNKDDSDANRSFIDGVTGVDGNTVKYFPIASDGPFPSTASKCRGNSTACGRDAYEHYANIPVHIFPTQGKGTESWPKYLGGSDVNGHPAKPLLGRCAEHARMSGFPYWLTKINDDWFCKPQAGFAIAANVDALHPLSMYYSLRPNEQVMWGGYGTVGDPTYGCGEKWKHGGQDPSEPLLAWEGEGGLLSKACTFDLPEEAGCGATAEAYTAQSGSNCAYRWKATGFETEFVDEDFKTLSSKDDWTVNANKVIYSEVLASGCDCGTDYGTPEDSFVCSGGETNTLLPVTGSGGGAKYCNDSN